MNDLAQFREKKMKQAEIEKYNTVRIADREEHDALFEEIQAHRSKLMGELSTNNSAQERQIIHDVLYDLKTVKNKIGSQLTAIVRAKMMSRKND
jgi:hypothetical protein